VTREGQYRGPVCVLSLWNASNTVQTIKITAHCLDLCSWCCRLSQGLKAQIISAQISASYPRIDISLALNSDWRVLECRSLRLSPLQSFVTQCLYEIETPDLDVAYGFLCRYQISQIDNSPRQILSMSSQKRGRAALDADSKNPQSPFVFYGTSLPAFDAHARDDGSYVPLWQQTAIDEKGRKRFHGAFTGGFSAGLALPQI
jgi:hypothetical protein